ncbi:MAG TPA: FAD-binding oxidoreductase, partial [Micromonosporaceae bacterium]
MTVTIIKPVRKRPQFHALPVAAIDVLTDDAVMVTFAVPDEFRADYAFTAGQHLTVRRMEDGEDVRRSYSICSTPRELAERGLVRIGVKAVAGGVFSRFATQELEAGQTVDV